MTLYGERADWIDLADRAKRFATGFGEKAAAWSVLLGKVLDLMVASFDRPEAQEINDFWITDSPLLSFFSYEKIITA